MSLLRLLAAFACAAFTIAAAHADDWTADKLRGKVLQLIDNQWQPLNRGMVVPDSRVVRTLAWGRVTFVRGNETVEIGPNTQIQIYDERGRKPFTTVKEYFGSVSVEAEVEQVQHFAVQTPYLAAVVKGTRFTVNSNDMGAVVSVQRGHVMVASYEDGSRQTISVGQSARVGASDGEVQVSGGDGAPVLLGTADEPNLDVARDKSGKGPDESSGKAKGKDKSPDGSSGSDNANSGKGNSGNGNSGKGSSSSGDGSHDGGTGGD